MRNVIPRFTAEASLYRTRGGYLATGPSISRSAHSTGSAYPAMMDDGGINCSNCVGGDCAALHCFENWTHSGGGAGGPYGGGGGGGVGGHGCVDKNGRTRGNGTVVTTTVVGPGGGPENTYIIRQRCSNGRWVDMGY